MADFLKALFGEGEALTYDQLIEKINSAGITPVNLADGKHLSVSKHEAQMKTLKDQVDDLRGQLAQRDADLADIGGKLTAAQADAEKLTGVQSELAALQAKYDKDTEDFNARLTAQKHEYSVREKAGHVKLTSGAAQREFLREALGTTFSYDKDDNMLGWDDFVAGWKAKNPDAFAPENPKEDEPATPPAPTIVAPSAAGKVPGAGNNGPIFGFNFDGVRPHRDTEK